MMAGPNTLAGIQAKHDALRVMLESLREGDDLTAADWDELFALVGAVPDSLRVMTAQVA